MIILFYILFYIAIICNQNFYRLNAVGEEEGANPAPIDISKAKSLSLKNSVSKNREEIRHAVSRRSETGAKKHDDNINRFLKRKRNFEDPSPPFYIINHPEHVGDGARLRLDFVHPIANGSCPNFHGTAEVVAGQWRIPPAEGPVVLNSGKNIGPDFYTELTPGIDNSETTVIVTTEKKKSGFFKGVQNFFRHSFHMDKTTTPIETRTKKTTKNPQDVTPNSFLQPPILRLQNSVSQEFEDLGKSKGTSFLKTKQPYAGHDATFNLHIKAVAIPKFQDIHGDTNKS